MRPIAHRAFAILLTITACGADDPATAASTTTSTSSTGAATSSTGAPDPTTSRGDPSTTDSGSSDTGGSSSSSTSSSTGAPDGTSTSDGSSSGDGSSSEAGSSSDSGVVPAGELRVLQMNLCHSGVAGCFTGDEAMNKAVAIIKEVAPGLVTLNEMCRDDLPWLAGQTGAVDHRFTPALKANDTPVKCKNGDDYGIGLLSWFDKAWDAPKHGVYAAQSSTTERRVWICMGYDGFVGCTTHLSTSGATAMKQCKAFVGGPLADAAADGPAVMAGDWNMKYKGSPNAQDCVSGGFYRKGDGSLQHVIASDDLEFIETVVIDMEGATDHPGLEVRLTLP